MSSFRIGIDTGGTFTDLILFNVETGEVQSLKVPSTPHEPLQAFIGAIRESKAGTTEITGLVHGTTVATNALIERKGAKVAFVTTAGFEDMPYIQRVNRQELYNLEWDKPRPLLRSRRHCFGLNERINAKREVVQPLDLAEVDRLAEALSRGGFEAVAVCLLFAYVNTEHEQAVKQRLQAHLNGMPLSISHEVAPIWREYERASTTIADAYLKPLIQRYVGSLQRGLDEEEINIPWALMKSNGGVMQAAAAADNPIQLAMSGPAGGLVASHYIAGLLGVKDVVTLDSGGTSADVGIIVEGELPYTTEYEIEWGIPAAIPLIDIKTVGAGGGSIAWVNAGGFLQVGPHSAGAEPGPICYGQGGTEPTLTDANLLLGRLNADYFLGGKMHLQTALARSRIEAMAAQLQMSPLGLAHAIVDIANENVANAIRMVSIERGHDPRRFALIAFGGAGPLHGAAIARKLGIPKVVIPPFPGNFSAMGLLMADLRVDKVWTQAFRSDQVSAGEVEQQFRQIAGAALAELRQQGYEGEPELRHFINLRYLGQNYETEIEIPPGGTGADQLSRAYDLFHQMHDSMYGYHLPNAVIELVSFKVTAIGAIPTPQIGTIQAIAAEPPGERPVYFAGQGMLPCRIIRRSTLTIGERLAGPLIVEEEGSTTLVEPGMHLTRTEHDILLLEVA
jgi:N-methylhydantoinase A